MFHFGEFARIYQSFLKFNECFQSNSIGSNAVFRFCLENKIKLLYSATSATFGNKGKDKNLSPYAFLKYKNLELLENLKKWFNFKYEVIYFYNVYGPKQICRGDMATVVGIFEDHYLRNKKLPVVRPGTQSRRFTHIQDTIKICFEAWKLNKNKHYSISSKKSYSIIQLANTSNFETTWLSNQRPIGIYESLITKISLSSNSQKFLTTTIARNNKVLDENLLPELDKVLFSNEHNKKFIVVHLIGSHLNYKNRYPDTFKVFKDEPLTKFESQESFNKINQYDNAILYTDFIASEIIKKIEALNVKSFVLFLSDHGEEVYKDRNMAGHNEAIPTKDMFDIPFMLWRSDKYKHDKMLSINFDRKYMIDDLFHSLSDLLSISSLEVDSTRSIFNRGFKDRKRIILDSVDYDTFFK